MDGKNYLSPIKILQAISTDEITFPDIKYEIIYFLSGMIKTYFLSKFIYSQSIIDLNNFYKTCTLIAYKTSNNQEQLDKMPYYIFNNFTSYLNEIVEEENKNQGGDNNSGNDMMGNANKMMQGHMNSAKSMMSGFSKPKF